MMTPLKILNLDIHNIISKCFFLITESFYNVYKISYIYIKSKNVILIFILKE